MDRMKRKDQASRNHDNAREYDNHHVHINRINTCNYASIIIVIVIIIIIIIIITKIIIVIVIVIVIAIIIIIITLFKCRVYLALLC